MITPGAGFKTTILFLVPTFAGAFLSQPNNELSFGRPSTGLSSSVGTEDKERVNDVTNAAEEHDNDPARYKLMESLYKAQVVMTPNFFSTLLPSVDDSLTTFHQNCVNAATVAPSTISGAGNGLFAERDLERGTIVTLYPVHATGLNFFDDGSSYWVTLDAADEEYFFRDTEGGATDANYLVYLLGNRSPEHDLNGAPFVDANPNRAPLPGWLAHYINDGAIVTTNSERGVLGYLESSSALANCAICPFGPSPLMAAVTTKYVKKGEELFTSYGSSYWLDALCSSIDNWPAKTDPILCLERAMAETMFSSMDRAGVTYRKEASTLESIFKDITIQL